MTRGRSSVTLCGVLALVSVLTVLTAAPVLAADRDGDGLRDGFEKRYGVTSPDKADTDGDGVVDSAEDNDGDRLGNLGEQRFGTHPGRWDTDRDGKADGAEDADGDGRSNAREQDERPLPPRLQPRLADAPADIAPQAAACGVRDGMSDVVRCHFGDADSDRTMVLMGDSKATMYLSPAIEVATTEGWHLVTLLKGRCPPILGTMPKFQRRLDDGASCRAWRNEALAWLRQDPPDLIVMVFSDNYALFDSRNRLIAGAARLHALRSGIKRTVAAMPAVSEVVLLADAPAQSKNPVLCLMRHPRDMSACVTVREPASAIRTDEVLRQAIVAAGGSYRTLKNKICPYKPCPLVQGETLVYRDRGHLTITFSQRLAAALRVRIAPLMRPTRG